MREINKQSLNIMREVHGSVLGCENVMVNFKIQLLTKICLHCVFQLAFIMYSANRVFQFNTIFKYD